MSKETYICYWSGEEPTTNLAKSHPNDDYYLCPPLNEMPAYVDVVNLFYATTKITRTTVNEETIVSGTLEFDRLTLYNSQEVITGWMSDLRAKNENVKILLTIISGPSGLLNEITDRSGFAAEVVDAVRSWGVDGVDIDYEPPSPIKVTDPNEPTKQVYSIVLLLKEIRSALTAAHLPSTMSGPIYSAWLPDQGAPSDYLQKYARCLDYLTTMDYTPYPGFDSTTSNYNQYVELIGTGSASKLAIGVSCMGPIDSGDFTPLADVKTLCTWEPTTGQKLGIMLFTSSYDVTLRYYGDGMKSESGTGQPDGTWLRTINEKLPNA